MLKHIMLKQYKQQQAKTIYILLKQLTVKHTNESISFIFNLLLNNNSHKMYL